MAIARTETIELLVDQSVDDDKTNAFETGGWREGSVHLPSTMTSTTISYQVTNHVYSSGDPTNWHALASTAAASITAVTFADNDAFPLPSDVFKFRFCRISTGSGESVDRTITVHLRD